MPSTTPYSMGLIDVPLGRIRPDRVPRVHPSVPAVSPGMRMRSTKSSPVMYCARPSRATSPAARASLRRTVTSRSKSLMPSQASSTTPARLMSRSMPESAVLISSEGSGPAMACA